MNAVLSIAPDGSVECLWTEAIPLESLGTLTVKRASNVEFNEASQEWEVILATAPDVVAFSHKSRAACIAWEVETINERLLDGSWHEPCNCDACRNGDGH
ncbi:MAG: hypothetical protein WCH99_08770 [Verrucomicrobiota bacterium]